MIPGLLLVRRWWSFDLSGLPSMVSQIAPEILNPDAGCAILWTSQSQLAIPIGMNLVCHLTLFSRFIHPPPPTPFLFSVFAVASSNRLKNKQICSAPKLWVVGPGEIDN
jgi:hypothetical protein